MRLVFQTQITLYRYLRLEITSLPELKNFRGPVDRSC